MDHRAELADFLRGERIDVASNGDAVGHLAERRVAQLRIELGLSDGINVEVADGLAENDLVVERPPKKIE